MKTNTKLQKFTNILSNLFLFCLGLLAFQSIFGQAIFGFNLANYEYGKLFLGFIEKIQYSLVILAIVFGSLIFWVNREEVESVDKIKDISNKRAYFYLVLIIILGTSFYLNGIGNYGFQGDEYYHAKVAENYINGKPLFYLENGDFYTRSKLTSILPILLYKVFSYLGIKDLFSLEFIFRLPFILISIISIFLFYKISKLYFKNNYLSLFTTLLFVSEIWFIYMAKYLRFYSVSLFVILLIVYILLKDINNKLNVIFIIILSIISWFYIQPYFLFILFFIVSYLVIYHTNRSNYKKMIKYFLIITILGLMYYLYKYITYPHGPYDNLSWSYKPMNFIYQMKWFIINYPIYTILTSIGIFCSLFNMKNIKNILLYYTILSLLFLLLYIDNVPFTFTHRPIYFFLSIIFIYSIYILNKIFTNQQVVIYILSIISISQIATAFSYNITKPGDRYFPTKLVFEKDDIIYGNKDISNYINNLNVNFSKYKILIIGKGNINLWSNKEIYRTFKWSKDNYTDLKEFKEILKNNNVIIIAHASSYGNRHNKLYEKIYGRKNGYVTEVDTIFSEYLEKNFKNNVVYISKDGYSKIFLIKK